MKLNNNNCASHGRQRPQWRMSGGNFIILSLNLCMCECSCTMWSFFFIKNFTNRRSRHPKKKSHLFVSLFYVMPYKAASTSLQIIKPNKSETNIYARRVPHWAAFGRRAELRKPRELDHVSELCLKYTDGREQKMSSASGYFGHLKLSNFHASWN